MSDSSRDSSPASAPVEKVTKPRKRAEHPSYNVMIAAAVKSLNERGGSSRQAILKYILANYKVVEGPTTNTHLNRALKAGVMSGTLKHPKGIGATGSFRLGERKEGEIDQAKKPKKAGTAKQSKEAKDATNAKSTDETKKSKSKSVDKAKQSPKTPKKANTTKKLKSPTKVAKPKKVAKAPAVKKAGKRKTRKMAK